MRVEVLAGAGVVLLASAVLVASAVVCAAETEAEDASVDKLASSALLDAGRAQSTKRNFDEAAALLEQSLEKWPENAQAVYWLARAREGQERGRVELGSTGDADTTRPRRRFGALK